MSFSGARAHGTNQPLPVADQGRRHFTMQSNGRQGRNFGMASTVAQSSPDVRQGVSRVMPVTSQEAPDGAYRNGADNKYGYNPLTQPQVNVESTNRYDPHSYPATGAVSSSDSSNLTPQQSNITSPFQYQHHRRQPSDDGSIFSEVEDDDDVGDTVRRRVLHPHKCTHVRTRAHTNEF